MRFYYLIKQINQLYVEIKRPISENTQLFKIRQDVWDFHRDSTTKTRWICCSIMNSFYLFFFWVYLITSINYSKKNIYSRKHFWNNLERITKMLNTKMFVERDGFMEIKSPRYIFPGHNNHVDIANHQKHMFIHGVSTTRYSKFRMFSFQKIVVKFKHVSL